MMKNNELKNRIKSSCYAGKEFTEMYYHFFNKRRTCIGNLYSENATLVWNGIGTKGKSDIQEYVLKLPNSEHTILSVDAQPILAGVPGDEIINLISVLGKVNNQQFNQTFIIKRVNNEWKIVSDCYRLQSTLE